MPAVNSSQYHAIKAKLQTHLYSYQKEFIKNKSRFLIVLKPRQIGMSYAAAFRAVLNALKGKSTIFLSTNIRNARRLIQSCKKALSICKIGISTRILVDNKDEIELSSGARILSLPNNPNTAVGESGDLIIDEASRFQNSKEILDATLPFISRGYSVTLISTPLGKRGMFWDFYCKSQEPHSNWKLMKLNVEYAIAQGCPIDLEQIKQEMDDISFRQNYLCEFVDDSVSFFTYELILANIDYEQSNLDFVKMRVLAPLKIAGYDPAKLVDAGVFCVLQSSGSNNKIKVVHTKEFNRVDYSEQIAYIVQAVKVCRISKLIIDATGVGVKLLEDLRGKLGSVVEGITYTNRVKEELITNLKLKMERRQISFPDNPKIIDQLHSIEREITYSGVVRYSAKSKGHDDYVFSICNALQGFGNVKKGDLTKVRYDVSETFNELI